MQRPDPSIIVVGYHSRQKTPAPCTGDRVTKLFQCCSLLQTPHQCSQIPPWRNSHAAWVLLLLRVESMCFNRFSSSAVEACYGPAAHIFIMRKMERNEWKITRIILEHPSHVVMPKCKVSQQSLVKLLNIYDKQQQQQQVEEDMWHFCDINLKLKSVIISFMS